MRAGLLQFRPVFGDQKANISKVTDMLNSQEYDLIVVPELANSGYCFSSENELESSSTVLDGGDYTEALKLISKNKSCFIVSGICEKLDGRYYNTSILVCPDGKVFPYRKIHLFDTEKKWFTPGNETPAVYEIEGSFGKVKLGMMICFDWFFPETARTLALQGAQIICHPSNLVLNFCQKAMFARAVENRVFTITANRTGTERSGVNELTFTGRSVMVSPKGEYLVELDNTEERAAIVRIEPELSLDKKVTGGNDLFIDRRKELYKL